MPSQSLEEILSRLNISGATALGGSSFANFLPILNGDGQLDPSLFTSTTSYYEVTTGGGGLGSIVSPTPGTIAVLDGAVAYVRLAASWLLISQLNSAGIAFTPAVDSGLVSTDAQSAINELAVEAISRTKAAEITGLLTFNRTGVPFAVTEAASGIVTNLNAELLDGNNSSYYRNVANLNTGILAAARLSGTYNINISGWAQHAYQANIALALDVSRLNNTESSGYISSSLLSGSYNINVTGNAATATNTTNLNNQPASYYLNPANLTGGFLPAAVFNDTAHGNRAGDTLHAVATTSVSGFLSASDKAKLDGLAPLQNAYSFIGFNGYDTLAAGGTADTLTLLSDNPLLTIVPNATNNSVTFTVDVGSLAHDSLDGLTTGDPHTQYLILNGGARGSQAITSPITFNRVGAPFIIGTNSLGFLVTGLNAELLNGQAAAYYRNAANLNSGYISVNRVQPNDTYPINITGTSAGALSLSTGGAVSGTVSVETLVDLDLSGGGVQLVGTNNDGKLITTGLTTELLPAGGGNNYFTFQAFYNAIENALQDSANGNLAWTFNGTTIVPALTVHTSQLNDDAGALLTWTNLNPVLTTNKVGVLNTLSGSNAVDSMTTTATPNTVALRDGSGNLAGVELQGTTLHITGTSVFNGLVTTTADPTGNNAAFATVGYVDAVTSAAGLIATYDLPIKNLTELSVTPATDRVVGELVVDGTGIVHVVNLLPGTDSSGWTDYTDTFNPLTRESTTASGGVITSIQFGNLLKAANLVNSPASPNIFCPALRLSEPYAADAYLHSVGGTNNYTNPNWRVWNKTAVQLRGRTENNYVLLVRIQGLVSLRHSWNLTYYTYTDSDYVKHTYNLNAAIGTWSSTGPGLPLDTELWKYVDGQYAIYVAGKSPISLEYELRDGKQTPANYCSFDGISPFAENGGKPSFNGGFLNLTALSVWSAAVNEPFSPYVPDSLLLQSEGDIVAGGINYLPTSSINDNRLYDGEDIIDLQGNPIALTKSGTDFPTYAVTITGTAYDKSCVRCSNPAVNKYLGINGFLRNNPVVTSGIGLTPPLAATQNALDQLTIAYVNTKLAVAIPTIDFDLMGKTVVMTGVTTMGQLRSAVNAVIGDCDNGIGTTAPINWFTLTYDGLTDRFKLELNCPADAQTTEPPIFDDADPLFQSLRLVFGTDSGDRGTNIPNRGYAYSLPQASGIYIKEDNSTLLSSFNTTVPLAIYSGSVGTLSIDGSIISYRLAPTTIGPLIPADTFATLKTKLESVGYDINYNKRANQVTLERLPATFSDTEFLTPPRVYDINGNLMSALGLVKESHGNADLPAQAVHRIVPLLTGAVMVGDFRSYDGTTSPGIARIELDGQINHLFNTGIGFSSPVYSVAEMSKANVNGSFDVIAAPLASGSYQGYNTKDLFRLGRDGTETLSSGSVKLQAALSPISGDAQTRILGLVTASNGDVIVLTPRKLIILNENGAVRTTYIGGKSFQGIVKFKEEIDTTYFIVASTAYSSPVQAQSIEIGDLQYVSPAGLRLFSYNQNSGEISIDSNWLAGNGAGVGAAASCAYPIIGGALGEEYVVCGNRAGWFNSGVTDESAADWSWNVTRRGNLFQYSQELDQTPTWSTNGIASIVTSTTGEDTQNVVTVTSGIGQYVQQVFDATLYQPLAGVAGVNNPGNITYEFDVELGLVNPNSNPPFVLIELRFDNEIGSNPAYSYAVTAQVDIRNQITSNRVIGFAPQPLPDNASFNALRFSAYDDLGNGRTVIRVEAEDTGPSGNASVIGRIYPTYNTISGNSSASPTPLTGALNVYKTALRYRGVWSDWTRNAGTTGSLGFNGINGVYVRTTGATGSIRPSVEDNDTNSGDFHGLYKISLRNANKGQAWPNFSVSPILFSEGQSHAIPFCTDSADNIYIGGPVRGFVIDNVEYPVTPWGVYKLNPLGEYLPNDSFNSAAKFNGKVTAGTITNSDYLILAGTFTCYNNSAANKLIFLDTSGKPLISIDPAGQDILVQANEPTNPLLFSKLWLDTSGVGQGIPPILKVYDVVTGEWINIVFSNRRLPAPAFQVLPNPNSTIDPDSIALNVASALDKINWDNDNTSQIATGVKLLCQVTQGGALPDLDSNGNINPDNVTYQYSSIQTVPIPVNEASEPITLTVYTQIVPSIAMKQAAWDPGDLRSFVFESEVVSRTFVINQSANTPELANNGSPIEGDDVINITSNATLAISNTDGGTTTFYYTFKNPNSNPFNQPNINNGNWVEYTGAITIRASTFVWFIGTSTGKKNSPIVGPVEYIYTPNAPTIGAVTVDNDTPTGNTAVVSGVGSGILYSFGATGPAPTIENFANLSGEVFYRPFITGNVTFNIHDLLSAPEFAQLSIFNSATNQIVININSVTVIGSPITVSDADIKDISTASGTVPSLVLSLSFTPSAQVTSDQSLAIADNHTLTKLSGANGTLEGGTPDQRYIYIKSTAGAGTALKYAVLPYNSGGVVSNVQPTTGYAYGTNDNYIGTVPYSVGWKIDLQGPSPFTLPVGEPIDIIYLYRKFDVITYTHHTDVNDDVFPSFEFFKEVYNGYVPGYVPGTLATFNWTAPPPTIDIASDADYGVYQFSATSADIGNPGVLYYTLNPTVNLLANPGSGTLMTGDPVSLDNASIQQWVSDSGQLKITVAEVHPTEGVSVATAYISQVAAAAPYAFLKAYQTAGSDPSIAVILKEITHVNPLNTIVYGKPATTELITVTDGQPNLSMRAIWGDTFTASYTVADLPVNGGTPSYDSNPSDILAFTPTSTVGEIRLGVRLYAPDKLPSRVINSKVKFNLPNIKFGGRAYVTTAPSPANSGTTLSIAPADTVGLPTTPFMALVYPDVGDTLSLINRPQTPEVIKITGVDAGTGILTIDRAEEGTGAQNIAIGNIFTIHNLRNYEVRLTSTLDSANIHYTLDGSAATSQSDIYLLGSSIVVRANTAISAIAIPAVEGVWGASSAKSVTYVTTPNYPNNLDAGLYNIAFGNSVNELSCKDITLQNPSETGNTLENCALGNVTLNDYFNTGLGFLVAGVNNKNCYWNIVNTQGFPAFQPLRNAKGSRNANNQVKARIYYGVEQMDLSTEVATHGTGTNQHLNVKGIQLIGLDQNTQPSGIVEITELPAGKYVVFAMSTTQKAYGASNPGNTVNTALNITNMSNSGVVLSNLSTDNTAFYFNGKNNYGDIRFYTDDTNNASRRTEVIGRWQAAIIGSNPNINPAPISFAITGTNLIALQMLPVVEILQPQTKSVENSVQKLIYPTSGSLPAGKYGLMYVHGAVKLPIPGLSFSGEGYYLTYNDADSGGTLGLPELRTIEINASEPQRFATGSGSSKLFAGSTTYINHAGGTQIQLEYFNSSVTSGDYSNNDVMTDPYNFPYNAVGSNYPYIAHGLAYTTAEQYFNDPSAAIPAPIFALFNQGLIEDNDYIEDAHGLYLHSPIFIPSLRSYLDLDTFGNAVELYSFSKSGVGHTIQILYTLDGSIPVFAGATTLEYTPNTVIPYTQNTVITAVAYDEDDETYSPVSSIKYSNTASLNSPTNARAIAGFNFRPAKYAEVESITDLASVAYPYILNESIITRYSGEQDFTTNTIGWVSTNSSTKSTIDSAIVLTLNDTTVESACHYQFSITADTTHDLTIAHFGPLNVYSEPQALGDIATYAAGHISVDNLHVASYIAAGWVVTEYYAGFSGMTYYAPSRQQITAGGNKLAVLYSETPDFNTYETIADIDVSRASAFVPTTGGHGYYKAISGISEISSSINNGLAINPVEIAAGQAGYFRFVPYQAINGTSRFGFVNTVASTLADMAVYAYVTPVTMEPEPVVSTNISSSRSTMTTTRYALPADGSIVSTITVTLHNYDGTTNSSNRVVTLNSTDSTDILSTDNFATSSTGSKTLAANGSGVATFKIKSATAANTHVSRLYATVADVVNGGTTTIGIDQSQYIRVGSVTYNLLLENNTITSTELIADNTDEIIVTMTLLDVAGLPYVGSVITYTGVTSGTLAGVSPAPTAVATSTGSNTTNVNGEALFTIKGTKSGTAVLGFSGTSGVGTFSLPSITFKPGVVHTTNSTYVCDPLTQNANGTAHITVTVTLKDAYFNPIDEHYAQPVALAGLVFRDESNVTLTEQLTTNENGICVFRITSTTPNTYPYYSLKVTTTDPVTSQTAEVAATNNIEFIQYYTVTYYGNGNTGGTAPVDGDSPYTNGATITALGAGSLVKTSFTFNGWNTAIDGSGLGYVENSNFVIAANTALYAQWV